MIEYDPAEQGEAPDDGDFGVKVIGVGGSGANVLDQMALEGSDEADLLTLNTDMRALSRTVSSEKIQLGSTLLKGMGTGGDPDLGKQSALEAVDEIRDAVRGNKMIFVCAGLGGGTGSGAAPEVCRIAKEEGIFLVVFATLPFSFEGERRMTQALNALEQIGRYANAVLTFENDRMGELIVPKDGVTQAFAAADKIISQSIRATINVVHRPGIIRIGMDDLLTSLDSEHSRCLFGYGSAKGDERSLEAVEQALKCPLLDTGKLLNNTRSVLVQVAGGDSMTLQEVQLVMQEITRHVGPGTQILFGTGTDKRLGNSLTVTVISSMEGPSRENQNAGADTESIDLDPLSVAAGDLMGSALADAIAEGEKEKEEGEEPTPAISLAEKLSEPEVEPESSSTIYEPLEIELPKPEMVVEPVKASQSEPLPMVVPKVEPKAQPEIVKVESRKPEDEALELETQPALEINPIAAAVDGDREPVDLSPKKEAVAAPPESEEEPILPPSFAGVSSDAEPNVAGDRVEAKTDSEETITLSRIVSEGKTGKVQTVEKGDLPTGSPVIPDSSPVVVVPTADKPSTAEAKQQQEMLQLDPVVGKGRFSKTDPTIVDGEDLDVPTFLRKKK